MKRKIFTIFLIILILSASCQSYQKQILFSNLKSTYIEINQPGIQLGACQAGLTNSEEEYKLMDFMGIEWIRDDFYWSNLENKPGVWNFTYYDKLMETAARFNKKVLIVLTFDVPWLHKEGDKGRKVSTEELPFYLNYVETIARRYGKDAAGFEIWNEPNTPMFWKGSDNDFFELSRRTAALLKHIAPDKPVAVGSIFYHPIMFGKSYLRKMIENGVLENADAVSLHPYGLSIEASAKRVKDADLLIKEYGYNKEIWITEFGVTTRGLYPNKTSIPKQANAVIEAIVHLSAAGADMITWFKLFNSKMPKDSNKGTSSEDFFGLAYPDFSLKPSGLSYSLLAKAIQGSNFVPDGILLIDISNRKLENYRFDRGTGETSLILWSNKPDIPVKISGYEALFTKINLLTGKQIICDQDSLIIINSDPVLLTGQLINQSLEVIIDKQ